ncbi:hypothetical protein OU798_00875 [Prolixibacteraceae bacterium Z1-6]|uniref:NigD-like C-terminal domain-containing protein n=1 Tax=Draconibacterium aestuarii TaxID=2998507 RepID=A0A9X3J415_9BACT|nr:hypothetical protein [Prolixibacteraceae bacterium Z1-6]
MKILKKGILVALAALVMMSCKDDDKVETIPDFAGTVVMAETANFDGASIISLDSVQFDVVENLAKDNGDVADYAWYKMEYSQTPEVGLGINVNLVAISYAKVESIVELDDVTASNDGITIEDVTVENGIITITMSYVGGKDSHWSELAYDAADFETASDSVVLTLIHDVNLDNGTDDLTQIAQFSLATLDVEIAEGAKLVIKYTDVDGEEAEFETGFEF